MVIAPKNIIFKMTTICSNSRLQGKLQNGLGGWRSLMYDSSKFLAHTPSLRVHTNCIPTNLSLAVTIIQHTLTHNTGHFTRTPQCPYYRLVPLYVCIYTLTPTTYTSYMYPASRLYSNHGDRMVRRLLTVLIPGRLRRCPITGALLRNSIACGNRPLQGEKTSNSSVTHVCKPAA